MLTPYVRANNKGELSIDSVGTFASVLGGSFPPLNKPILDIIQDLDNAVKSQHPTVSQGALSNVHGDWYEWLLGIVAWNTFVTKSTPFIAFPMPNISRFDCATLYTPELMEMIGHLRQEVSVSGVGLISSNPDFVIIKDPDLAQISLPKPITAITASTIALLENAYSHYVGKCEFEKIRGYLATKSSLRPDRRLQIPHEGSLMKALYVHLQTRLWITNPEGIKYYAASCKVGKSDISALRTVATHSITTVSSQPQAAVDHVFQVNSLQEAEDMFDIILRP